ncbi:alpha/beta fold hydrolase [Rhodococcus sp. HNM0569]|uniref:alpha/beta hydrolase family protein n=1 Tax=Rhodococcus sp. HNM0569 TaxID=2716340 RepID=UPI00146B7145|nr:alpha/beta fold hydrolase [Rhodococcus sp. HNM0569]NLU83668.1 alpha/beta fold hydrolase [Rhodococcus sp. HNM0569]
MTSLRWAALVLTTTCAVLMSAALVSGCASLTESSAASTPAPVVPASTVRVAYGTEPDQFGDLYLPATSARAIPVVVMIHGGGWHQKRDLTYFAPLAQSLVDRGVAVWNIEYRRTGGAGGWPMTLADANDAVEALAGTVQGAAGGRLDLARVHLAGHSAGGQLAAYVASRHNLPTSAPGAQPNIRAVSLTTMAGVFDLSRAYSAGDRFLPAFLGAPADVPDRYAVASPILHLPLGLRVNALHGALDLTVPADQSTRFVDAARIAGDPASVQILPFAGHGDFGNAMSPAWFVAHQTILESVFG